MPHARLVELYVGEVYGGTLDLKELAGGAIPIETQNETLRQQLIQLYMNSNWQSNKSLYVRFGTMLGDVAVKVVDDRQLQQCYLEVLHPGKIHTLERNSAGDVEFVRIEYDRADINPTTGNSDPSYTYTDEIDPTEFRTFRDGKPWDYFNGRSDGPTSNWRNDYGFVPLDVVQHRDLGLGWGACAYHHTRHKVDEINDAWSILDDSVRKAVNIVWFFHHKRSDITITPTERDNVPKIFGGNAADSKPPFAMVPNVPIGEGGQNILNLLTEVERDLPELALHSLRQSATATAPGIRAAWSDAIDRIVEARGNYDGGQVRLNKMGVMIGSMMRYPGFEGQRYTSLEDERLEHSIAERAVIEDQLTEKEQLDMLRNLPGKPEQARLVLDRLKIPEETIDRIVAEIKLDQQQTMMQEQQRQLPGQPPPQLPAGQGIPNGGPRDTMDVSAEVQRIMAELEAA